MKILVVGPSWIGDMVMSQSLYITLKQQDPDAVIDVLAPAWCKPILERMPEVNQAIEMPIGHGDFSLSLRLKVGSKLKSESYTHAYVLPRSAKSALIPWFARIPIRIGWKGEFRHGLLTDLRKNMKSFQFMAERYYALAYPANEMTGSDVLGGIENAPYPQLSVDKDAQSCAIEKFGLDPTRRTIALCPGAAFGSAKKWPEYYYAKVADEMCEKGYQVWIFGGKDDLKECETLVENISEDYREQVTMLAGKTSLIEVVDLLAICQSVVGNDSGLLHMASALNCHVVGIYGPTSPDYAPPLTENKNIVYTGIECSPCAQRECPLGHNKCMKDLLPRKSY